MKLSAVLVTTLGFFLSTTEARDIRCYHRGDWSIIPSEAPDLIHRTTEFCRKNHGKVVKPLWNIKIQVDYPNGNGSGERSKVAALLYNMDRHNHPVDGQLCTDLFADVIGTCPTVENPDTPHILRGGAAWAKPIDDFPGGWVAQIHEDIWP